MKDDQKMGLRRASLRRFWGKFSMCRGHFILVLACLTCWSCIGCQAFTMLCADETPMVRRAAAHKMRDFVSVCAKQVATACIPSFERCCSSRVCHWRWKLLKWCSPKGSSHRPYRCVQAVVPGRYPGPSSSASISRPCNGMHREWQ